MSKKELNQHQIERQDFVDNAIFNLLQSLNPTDKEIQWDIEIIGDVRKGFAKKLKLRTHYECF